MGRHTIRFERPWKAWSTNEGTHTRQGHMVRLKQKDAWRRAAITAATDADLRLPLGPSTIQVTIPFDTGRRRDPHNYVGTVCKSVIDGLVQAGVWPDDNPEYVTVIEPKLVVGTEVIIVIEPRTVELHG